MGKQTKTLNVTWDTMPNNGCLLIMGQRGEGKSSLAWMIAEKVAKKHRMKVATYGMPLQAQKVFPKRFKHFDTVRDVSMAKKHVIIIDEAATVVNARRAMSSDNTDFIQLIELARHKDSLIIFVHQHSRQVDIQIMMSADLVIFKRPSQLHVRASRGEFRPEVRAAYERFDSMTKTTSQKHAMIVDFQTGKMKLVKSWMPSWWSTKVSKAFANVTIG